MAGHAPKPWTIGTDETPWTCGDSQTAIEHNEPLGHTEILFPILNMEGDPLAYMPWEPLAGEDRQNELRSNARLIAKAPELLAAVREADRMHVCCCSRRDPSPCLKCVTRALLAEIDGEDTK